MCMHTAERLLPRRPPALPLSGAALHLSAPPSPPRPLPFASRSRLPEIFTFDLESVPAAAQPRRPASRRPRPRRVLYPAQTRRNRYLPPEERSPAMRALYLLCLVIAVQVCLEEGEPRLPRASGQCASNSACARLGKSLLQLRRPAAETRCPVKEPTAALQELQSVPQEPAEDQQELQSVLHEEALQKPLLQEPALALLHHTLQEPATLRHNLTCYPLQGRAIIAF